MKAIPMRGKLVGKRILGMVWAGRGQTWRKKENYFQLEDNNLVSAFFSTPSGNFEVRCYGATCRVTLQGKKGEVLSTAVMALPRGRKK